MSQYPPTTPPPPGYNPAFPPGAPPPAARTSAAAVTSLVCGLICCIPFVTPLLAVIFGIVGISATRKPNVSGRGLAIAGLILGVIGLASWGGMMGLGGMVYLQTAPARSVATQFLRDTSLGNLQAAQANAASTMPASGVSDLADAMKPLGSFSNVTFTQFDTNGQMGQPARVTLGGIATFANGPKGISMVLVKEGGTYKVESCELK